MPLAPRPAIPPASSSALDRRLGPVDAAAIVISNVIGGGIFFVPIIVAQMVGSPTAILWVWLLGGALAFAGAMDNRVTFLLSGNGDLIEPDDGIIAIGSGGAYALAAAKALARHTSLDARTIAAQAMEIAAAICIYTNSTITIEEL